MTIDLNAMLAKRAEVLGEGNKFDVALGDKTFYFVAPELASSEWNDRHQAFLEDIQEGLLTSTTAREEFLGLALEDQAEEFAQVADNIGVDPFIIAQMAFQEHAESVGKTQSQKSLNRTQRRAKRR
ncbi:hypothetical protein Q6D62_00930 [Corynebacterium diphtheriae]|uniref:hypothetical protein n=1 Tax=Corynebacterium diphtheriae TaxID=1717 RepID=UPI000246905D|nr:hypothetical protein [Corynebacterium diphtheriae]AEX68845.1 hypothetical protein CDPW8_0167 [Corynebacterium diphtheriae PW8]AEX68885.1 hypothetical protein CDPW8_0208 [Corynebacterium diphtheriae PW8]EIK57189.1 hypothetical protein W5M_00848 [Corynebacterium diphtheriae bv. intermedius str. NCTC 5011]OFI53874.1 hypothetical protein BKD83_01545 [Corynebacterium diphtheriae]OJI02063.1 hypothetical protein BKD75_10095 [Corynebacterium diphtheriae]